VAAARELFEARGYAGTTIDAVAERAGVSRRTVFLSVGSKAALLKTAWDWAVVGDDEPVPMLERPHILAMQQVTDPGVLVRHWVGQIMEIGGRVAALAAVLAGPWTSTPRRPPSRNGSTRSGGPASGCSCATSSRSVASGPD
jgi:hypothetical protein